MEEMEKAQKLEVSCRVHIRDIFLNVLHFHLNWVLGIARKIHNAI